MCEQSPQPLVLGFLVSDVGSSNAIFAYGREGGEYNTFHGGINPPTLPGSEPPAHQWAIRSLLFGGLFNKPVAEVL
jgi:hypothetical protein